MPKLSTTAPPRAGNEAVPSGAGFSSTLPDRNAPPPGVNRRALERHLDQILFAASCPLDGDGTSFACRAEAHHAVTVADDDQRAEAQVLAALDDPSSRDDRTTVSLISSCE